MDSWPEEINWDSMSSNQDRRWDALNAQRAMEVQQLDNPQPEGLSEPGDMQRNTTASFHSPQPPRRFSGLTWSPLRYTIPCFPVQVSIDQTVGYNWPHLPQSVNYGECSRSSGEIYPTLEPIGMYEPVPFHHLSTTHHAIHSSSSDTESDACSYNNNTTTIQQSSWTSISSEGSTSRYPRIAKLMEHGAMLNLDFATSLTEAAAAPSGESSGLPEFHVAEHPLGPIGSGRFGRGLLPRAASPIRFLTSPTSPEELNPVRSESPIAMASPGSPSTPVRSNTPVYFEIPLCECCMNGHDEEFAER